MKVHQQCEMTMSKFENVIITGSNRGLGLEFVNYYSQHSKRVIACCRDPESATKLRNLQNELPNIEIIQLDVTKQTDIHALQDHLGNDPVDLLINNAGVGASRQANSVLDTQAWSDVFQINSIAPIQISTLLSKNLTAGSHSVVANITSKMGSIADNTSGGAEIYRSSKAALNAASKSFALAHIAKGITTVLLHPGWVRTDMGGPSGLIDVTTSVTGMALVLESITPANNAQFFDYQANPIPW